MGTHVETDLANNCVNLVFVAICEGIKGFLKVYACQKGKWLKQIVINHSGTIAERTITFNLNEKMNLLDHYIS